ncbi:YhzD family protein [Ectobacillus sp. sgz5001026]|uniref:YhzD family protein n=1 Tax=Ectobacillus sp. sgz5001026 TaxID=3242473 RepID=UPI0036D3857C
METYTVTAFDKGGHVVLDQHFTATNDNEAKKKGEQLLVDNNVLEQTHRCINSRGKLLLFHS